MNCYDTIAFSFEKLKNYCEKENFEGWDPYDGLNSKIFQALPFANKNKTIRLAWIQFFKRSVINFRKIAFVKKGLNPKGVALFISGYCNLAKLDLYKKSEIFEKIEMLADLLIQIDSHGYSGSCWGYNFDWQSRAFFQPKSTPTIVATTYAANALIDAYETTQNERYLEKAITSKNFVINDLNRTYLSNGDFAFSYSPLDKTSVFNASLLGVRLLSRIYSYTKDNELRDITKKAIDYCISFQNPDGSWCYGTLPFHNWIDSFHTGFNLECISDYNHFMEDKSVMDPFEKGMAYYLTTFFDPAGRSKYYNNTLFPIDIHAPSQLIITLAKTNRFNENIKLIENVLNWTITNMQSPKGYFYYQKKRNYTIKTPYMRWSQAWMFYAISHYLLKSAYLKKKIES